MLPFVNFWTLNLGTGLQEDVDVVVPGTTGLVVAGTVGNIFPTTSVASPTGISPGLVMAVDNTLGSFSPFQGRIYAAFVGYFNVTVSGVKNPTDNTDIFLTHSDDGGRTWSTPVEVNDDDSQNDGSTASGEESTATDSIDEVTGRPQFQPEIAVDPTTGTVVVSWRDARNDVARARVATYIATSIDGGQTFGPEVYANPSQTAVNAITNQTVILGPEPDNESGGNTKRDATFGYGTQMGLAVYAGQIFPIWAGNFNLATVVNGAVQGPFDTIEYQPMVIAAGPRIITSAMGPIPLAEATSGTIKFTVTFDRPINPPSLNGYTTTPSFTTGDVLVYYHDTTNGDPSVPLQVQSITPVASSGVGPNNRFGFTEFTVAFASTPAGVNPATYNYTGTYSYMILPDNGSGTTLSAPIPSFVNIPVAEPVLGPIASPNVPLSVPTSGTGGSGTSDDITTSTITLANTNYANATITGITVNLTLAHQRDGDLLIELIAPNGSESILYFDPGDRGQNFTNTTFSDLATGSILGANAPYSGTFQPFSPLASLDGSQVNGTYRLVIDDEVADNTGSLTSWSITVNSSSPSFQFQNGDPLDQNADGTADENPLSTPFTGLTPGDIYAVPSPAPAVPVTFGTNPLSILKPAFDPNTLPLIVPGPQILSTSVPGGTGTSNEIINGTTSTFDVTFDRPIEVSSFTLAQVLSIVGPTGPIAAASVMPLNAVNGAATEFQIAFPLQELSGTYTIQLGTGITDTFGDALDGNQNAGVAVERDTGQNSPTITVLYTSSDLPKAIPAPSATNPGEVSSTIVVPDNFIVQGDSTTSGISGLRVQINLSYADDPDLSATLYYNMGKPGQVAVPLFDGVGTSTSTANFTNTIFDDRAATPIQNGNAPFFATFNPQIPLSDFAGLNAAGTWTLVIQNATTGSKGVGTINSWSLSFQKPAPTSGLGEPGSDNVSTGFRIFTLGQTDALSGQTWTAVGPAAITGGSGQVSAIAVDPSDPSGNTVYVTAASGGIWKTTDFLTTNPNGPTYIPLTDFGPTPASTSIPSPSSAGTRIPISRSSSPPPAAAPAARVTRSPRASGS